MLIEDQIKEKLYELLSEYRYKHSLGVQEVAVKLAKKYGANERKASIAGLAHDCAKDLDMEKAQALISKYNIIVDDVCMSQRGLLHAPLGAALAHELFGIDDEEILNAIRYHTTGKPNMTLLEKIIYLSDYIEPNRNFEGVEEMRELAFKDLDKAVLMAMDKTIRYVIDKKEFIHVNTVTARNYLLNELTQKVNLIR